MFLTILLKIKEALFLFKKRVLFNSALVFGGIFLVFLAFNPDFAFNEGLPSLNAEVTSIELPELPVVNVDQVIEDKTSIKEDIIPQVKSTSGYGLAFLCFVVIVISLIRHNS